jgi:large subunit ribosomal protein L11
MIMAAGLTKPSPAVGQVLGPLGINSMNFIKEVNSRTSTVRPEVPLHVTVVPYSDKTHKIIVRTPQAQWFLMRAARVHTASANGALTTVGNITLKEIFHIAQTKAMDPAFIGCSLRSICVSLIGTARAMGLKVTKDLEIIDRDDTRVVDLPRLRKETRASNKLGKKISKK